MEFPIKYSLFTDDGWYLYNSNSEEHLSMNYDSSLELTLYGSQNDNSEKNLEKNGVYGYVITRLNDKYINMSWNGITWDSIEKEVIKAYGEDNCTTSKDEDETTIKCKIDNVVFRFEYYDGSLDEVEVYDNKRFENSKKDEDIDYTTKNENITKSDDFYGSYNGVNLTYPINLEILKKDGFKEENGYYKSDKYKNAIISFGETDETPVRRSVSDEEDDEEVFVPDYNDFTVEFKGEDGIPQMTFNGVKPFATKEEVIKVYGKPSDFEKNELEYDFDNDDYSITFSFNKNKLNMVNIINYR